MANVPVKTQTHEEIKEMRINLSYITKKDFSQDDVISLMLRNTSVEALVEAWKVENVPDYKPVIEEKSEELTIE